MAGEDAVIGAFFLLAAVLHACLAVILLTAAPRPRSWWLLLLLLAFSGASSFARAWGFLSPATIPPVAVHRISVDLEWPLSFVVLALALVWTGRRVDRRLLLVLGGTVAVAWLVVVLWKDVLYGESPPGFHVETDWRALVVDRWRFYATMAAALGIWGAEWSRRPAADPVPGLLMLAFAFGPLQAAPELIERGLQPTHASAYGMASRATHLLGPAAILGVCLASVARAALRDVRASIPVAAGMLVALVFGALYMEVRRATGAASLPGFGEVGYLVVRPAILAFVIVRHSGPEREVRVPRGVVTVMASLLAAFAFLPVEELTRRAAPVPAELALPVGVVGGLAVSFACFLLLLRVGGRSGSRAGRLAGRYRIVRELGRGASGPTMECVDEEGGGARVAVKVIETGATGPLRERALAEAKLHAELQNPFVVRVRASHELPESVLLVMDVAEGGSLASRLERSPEGLGADEARGLLTDVLCGLSALHAQGIAHGDIKPSNVLLTREGRAQLADLGVARQTSVATLTGLAGAGTPAYMAPERFLGGAADTRSDVFATGALLHECLLGRPPRRAWTDRGVEEMEARPTSLPSWASTYLRAALARSPVMRPADASAALGLLSNSAGLELEQEKAAPDTDHVA